MALISELTAGSTASNNTMVPVEEGNNNYKFPIGTVTTIELGEVTDADANIPARVIEIIQAHASEITMGGTTIIRASGWTNQVGAATMVCHRVHSHATYNVIVITMYIGAKMYFGQAYFNQNTLMKLQFTTNALPTTEYSPS